MENKLDEQLKTCMLTDPDQFVKILTSMNDFLSEEMARKLDELDPLKFTRDQFVLSEITPLAGHSLGPVFKPSAIAIQKIYHLQETMLHEGHFKSAHPDGQNDGHWFDCDRQKTSMEGAKALLGFNEFAEFCFTESGLSKNLANLMDTFYRPTKQDWESGNTKILMLDTEFFSDQAVVNSVITRKLRTAMDFGVVTESVNYDTNAHVIKVHPDEKGLYLNEDIIAAIKKHAAEIKLISLSEIVFNTGQRLDLQKIFTETREEILKNNIIVGLDLAHTVGNRFIDLKNMPIPIVYAVGCAYKHISGPAGSPFGIYVNAKINLQKFPPLQGWKAADSDKVFGTISQFNPAIMSQKGAEAFRISNPPPVALASVQSFLSYFNTIGFDKCFHKSECLTRYLIMQLKHQLGDLYEPVTPEFPNRGAMIAFRINGITDVSIIEQELRKAPSGAKGYEIDVRHPNIRITAHYGYTSFRDIYQFSCRLSLIVENILDLTSNTQCRF